jgi:photosystem II stability/assembly factor-like uncharacterized protein
VINPAVPLAPGIIIDADWCTLKFKPMKSCKFLFIIFSSFILFFVSCTKDEPLVFKGALDYSSESSNINYWCSSVYFVSKKIGYSTADNGKIYKTVDGGQQWTLYDTKTAMPLNGTFFLNEKTGYIFGGKANCSPYPCNVPGSIMFKTSNGGNSWARQSIPYSWSELNSAHFFNENSGMVVGLGLCIKTADGGNTWNSLTIGNNNISKVSFKSKETGYSLDLIGRLFKTEDAGQSWRELTITENRMTSDFCFISESMVYANDNNQLYKTSDGGESWELIVTPESSIRYIYFITENTGLVLGKKYLNSEFPGLTTSFTHIVQLTNDGGKTWLTREFEEQELNDRCLFFKDNILYSLAKTKIFKLTIE